MSESTENQCSRRLLDVVSDRSQRKFGAVTLAFCIAVHVGDRTCASVWASQAVEADNKEPCHIEGSSSPSHQRTPPISHIGTPRQGVAYDQRVVSRWREFSPSSVSDWDIEEGGSRLECERWYDGDVLLWNQSSKRVLRLARGSLYGI